MEKIVIFLMILSAPAISGQTNDDFLKYISGEFDFTEQRTSSTQFYELETEVKYFAKDGSISNFDIFRLKLKYEQFTDSSLCTCENFEIALDKGAFVKIPELIGWNYKPKLDGIGIDAAGQVFGVDHSKFENILDEKGKSIPNDKTYMIYNCFIDFHGFIDVFTKPDPNGGDISGLKKIGDRVIHSASHTKPPVNLGSKVNEGSYFQNGEITLEFKGLSNIDQNICGIVLFDSGESSFKMKIEPMENFLVETNGSSHYWGDIHINLDNNTVQKVDMSEVVVSLTSLPVEPKEISMMIERTCRIINVTK